MRLKTKRGLIMSNTLMTLQELYETHDKLEKNDIILDVRRPDEFEAGHIPGAKNIPLDQVVEKAQELKQYNKIYIHCKRGGRAKNAYELLGGSGLNNLICIHDAGMDQWMENGYPVKN